MTRNRLKRPLEPWTVLFLCNALLSWLGWRSSNVSQKNFTTQRNRSRDQNGGFIEAYYFCADSHTPKSPMQLLKLAKSAEYNGLRSEIGEVSSGDTSKPKPFSDGINASIQRGDSTSFWSLNENADFFCQLAPIEPLSNDSVFLNRRMKTVAELLAHSFRLYTAMGLRNSSRVHLTLTHARFPGLSLNDSSEPIYSNFSNIAGAENIKTTSVPYTLEELGSDFAAKVMELCTPFLSFSISKNTRRMCSRYIRKTIQT